MERDGGGGGGRGDLRQKNFGSPSPYTKGQLVLVEFIQNMKNNYAFELEFENFLL